MTELKLSGSPGALLGASKTSRPPTFAGAKNPAANNRQLGRASKDTLEALVQRLQALPKPILLILDYDGTLRKIDLASDSRLNRLQISVLRRLARLPQDVLQLAVDSGRPLHKLRNFIEDPLPGENILLVGQFSGESYDMRTATQIKQPDPALVAAAQGILNELRARQVVGCPGTAVENKQTSLTVFFKDDTGKQALTQALSAIVPEDGQNSRYPDFTWRGGKDRFEVVPRSFNKGNGVKELMALLQQRYPNLTYTPVFIGDDISDLDGIHAAEQHPHGGGILVNNPALAAQTPNLLGSLPTVPALYRGLREAFLPKPTR